MVIKKYNGCVCKCSGNPEEWGGREGCTEELALGSGLEDEGGNLPGREISGENSRPRCEDLRNDTHRYNPCPNQFETDLSLVC